MIKHNSHSTTLNPALLLAGLGLIAAWGIIFKLNTIPNPPDHPQIQTPETGNWKKITNPNVIFFSKIFLDRQRTFIYIPIRFEKNTQISWFSLNASASAQPRAFLITHPALENLDWPELTRDTVHLFQRQKTYASIDAFVASPPNKSRVAVESGIKALAYYAGIDGSPLDDQFSPDSVDYILTTYTKPKYQNGIYYYENTIDASFGDVNSNQNLTWQLNVPSASENSAFYLGDIHIDYNRHN